MMRGSATLVAVCGICLAATRSAAQTTKLPAAYVAVKAGLAPAGGLSGDSEGASLAVGDNEMPVVISPAHQDSSLNISFNAEVEYLFSLHPYFALGPALGVHTWQSKSAEAAGEGVSTGLDLSLLPQVRLPVSESFEFYLSVPIGITLSLLSEYKTWVEKPNEDKGTAEDVDPAYGWNFGLYLGARLAIDGSFGVLTEFGYQRVAVTHGVDFQVLKELDEMGSGTTLDLALVTSQLRWNVGVFF